MTSPLSDLVHELRAEAETLGRQPYDPHVARQMLLLDKAADRLESALRAQAESFKECSISGDVTPGEIDTHALALQWCADELLAGLEGDDGEQ